jgi:hypothetical protein
MGKSKTFTLKGAAAGEFIRAQSGHVPKDDDERAMRIATLVGLNMQTSPEAAAALIKLVAREGLEAAAKVCTADR